MGTSPSASSFPSLRGSAVDDCPQCGSLCLGAAILTCSHLCCRKCLREHHGSELECHSCQRVTALPKGSVDFRGLVQSLGSDPVVVRLVNERLRSQGRQSCLLCPNREAAALCLDCNEPYCDACGKAHTKQRVARDHILQTLPQALRNTSSMSSTSQASSRTRSESQSSTASERSIRNVDDRQPSRDPNRWKQWAKREIELLQSAANNQARVTSALNDIIAKAQEMLSQANTNEDLLACYIKSLRELKATEHDANTFTVTTANDDVSVHVNKEALQRRLNDVKNQCWKSSAAEEVESLRSRLDDIRLSKGRAVRWDPMTSNPSRVFVTWGRLEYSPPRVRVIPPREDGDNYVDNTICCTADGKTLVVAEYLMKTVKVVNMDNPQTVSSSLTLDERPYRLFSLPDDLIAATTDKRVMFLLEVGDGQVRVTSQIETAISYKGVGGLADGKLVVSCTRRNNDDVARVDVIDRSGDVIRTIITSDTLTQLVSPEYLCVVDNHVLLSDLGSDAVYKVSLSTGQLVDTLTHPDLKYPCQVAVDNAGHLYVTSFYGCCVLVRSVAGRWRKLLEASVHSGDLGPGEPFGHPFTMCITASGLVVKWEYIHPACENGSVGIGYDL